jgi:hypothetical protein
MSQAPTADLFVPRTALEKKLVTSLWSFHSSYWSGFVDFRGAGHYQTHWGWGTWRALGPRSIRMHNSYDGFWFVLEFDDALMQFVVRDSNHPTRSTGHFLYAYGRPSVALDERELDVRDVRPVLPTR